jgi:hypothetical protein
LKPTGDPVCRFQVRSIVCAKEQLAQKNGGQGWIRTSVRETRADLQSAAFNHSATCPLVHFGKRSPMANRAA